MHVFLQIPADDVPDRYSQILYVKAVNAGMYYEHPIFDRKTSEQIRTQVRPTIYDRAAVTGSNRLLFKGAPHLTEAAVRAGVTLRKPEFELIDGGVWNTHQLQEPDEPSRRRFNDTARAEYTPGERCITQEMLSLDMTIETELGEMTVEEYWLSDHGKLRAQAGWRGSTSWNAFFSRYRDGRPFLHDNGLHENWKLPADVEEKFKEALIAAFCDEVYAGEGALDWAAVKDLATRGVKLQMETEALMEVFGRLKEERRVRADLREVRKYVQETRSQTAAGDREAGLKEMIDRFNAQHAVVHIGGKSLLMTEGGGDFTLSKKHDFVEVRYAHDKKNAQRWLASKDRREYSEIIFDPSNPGHHDGKYNLFSGFGVRPVEGDCSLFATFVKDVICNGDEEVV